jgi:hypothetical protein
MKRYPLRAALAAFLLLILLVGCGGADGAPAEATVVAGPTAQPTKPPPVVAANNTATSAAPADEAATGEPTATGESTGDPDAPPPTPTAVSTVAPTEAPPTEVPTEAPTAEPTAIPPTARPVVQPTAVPPTATPAPPTPTPQLGANGLIASHFAIQDRADLVVNGKVWFEFNIANSTGGDVPFDALGVMPKKDGVDRPEWYQHSYGGNNDVVPSGGLNWEDHIDLPEAGNYTLRMVICFDGPACKAQTGTWHTISQEIPITIQ